MKYEFDMSTPKSRLLKEIDSLSGEVARLKMLESAGKAGGTTDLYGQLLDMLDILGDGLLILDRDRNIKYANQVIRNIMFRQGIVGKNITEAYPPSLGQNFLKNLVIALTENKPVNMLEYYPAIRSWYQVSIKPFGDFTAVIFYDKSIYERLSEQYKLTHYTMNNVREYVLWVNINGSISSINDYVRRSLGYSGKALYRSNISQIIMDFPEPEWNAFKLMVENELSVTFESDIKDVYDRKFPGEVTANFVRFKNNGFIVFFIQDISKRKKAINELNAAKAQAELYLDLMCHDINNMNQAGMGFLELALESEDVGEDSRAYLNKTMESFEKSTALIDNVKKLQSSKSGALLLRPIDVGDIVERVVNQSINTSERDISVNFEYRSKCEVMANDLVKDIFENIIGNAIKHSTGTLKIDVVVDKAVVNGAGQCRISIEDNGPGIPDEAKHKVLSRIDVNKQRATGKGLGLYLVKTLVEDFHGQVGVEDRIPGDHTKGTRFVVLLPAVK